MAPSQIPQGPAPKQRKYTVKMVGAGAKVQILDNLEQEPYKNRPALEHCRKLQQIVQIGEKISILTLALSEIPRNYCYKISRNTYLLSFSFRMSRN
jgi:hypothetical protein